MPSAAPNPPPPMRFSELPLAAPLLQALESIGYESPSPIQARTIPPLLDGRDLIGQAQTGTGKTAAFALPILSRLELAKKTPQALVLAPTRELAIQVAEAFQKYAGRLPGFHVLPIYGGQSYAPQLKGLKRGAQVVVGTPGRVVDHIKRGTLKLDAVKHLVLDEADEMLRMGFIDDVEWVLQRTPQERQIALFSATMPPAIRRVAQTYLRDPVEVTIKSRTTTGANIRQRYWLVSGLQKLDALTRFLETEDFDGMLVFVRTKAATQELADRLEARGFAAAALNGDMEQKIRERTVARLKHGQIDILVATDVAARGLDVERISHVVNYDIPTDTESYVHRIGRTGRAGRSGEAILFVSPRERHLLKAIERATRQPIEALSAPSADAINRRRLERFKQTLAETLDAAQTDADLRAQIDAYRGALGEYELASGTPLADLAATLAVLAQSGKPMLPGTATTAPASPPPATASPRADTAAAPPRSGVQPETPRRPARAPQPPRRDADRGEQPEMETFRLEVGQQHGVKAANIVGAIANEAGLDSRYIGRVEILDDHSLVELPVGMPKAVFRELRKVWVCSRQLQISRLQPDAAESRPPSRPRGARRQRH
ncbi:MAG: DEAD/DEAH box helicase [Gammaproteobacteria bacterium]|nr:DEAD/DEAH box helicase [Gammaproteobacteria bacterium]